MGKVFSGHFSFKPLVERSSLSKFAGHIIMGDKFFPKGSAAGRLTLLPRTECT
jgi:hypothetical protein